MHQIHQDPSSHLLPIQSEYRRRKGEGRGSWGRQHRRVRSRALGGGECQRRQNIFTALTPRSSTPATPRCTRRPRLSTAPPLTSIKLTGRSRSDSHPSPFCRPSKAILGPIVGVVVIVEVARVAALGQMLGWAVRHRLHRRHYRSSIKTRTWSPDSATAKAVGPACWPTNPRFFHWISSSFTDLFWLLFWLDLLFFHLLSVVCSGDSPWFIQLHNPSRTVNVASGSARFRSRFVGSQCFLHLIHRSIWVFINIKFLLGFNFLKYLYVVRASPLVV